MSKEVLYILLPDFAEHEMVYLAQAIASDEYALKDNPKYVNKVVPIVSKAIDSGKIVGAICNAASFMAKHGFLNAIAHTGNGQDQLRLWGGDNYTNSAMYRHQQAVSDRRIVTANGSATLEFAKELLLLLENDTPERIEMFYQFNKQGFCELFK